MVLELGMARVAGRARALYGSLQNLGPRGMH